MHRPGFSDENLNILVRTAAKIVSSSCSEIEGYMIDAKRIGNEPFIERFVSLNSLKTFNKQILKIKRKIIACFQRKITLNLKLK